MIGQWSYFYKCGGNGRLAKCAKVCEKWPGKIIAVCDYKARDGLNLVLEDGVYRSKPTPKQEWDEGYRFWWDLSNVRRLPEPITCRGNVGMWQLPESLAAKVEAAGHLNPPC